MSKHPDRAKDYLEHTRRPRTNPEIYRWKVRGRFYGGHTASGCGLRNLGIIGEAAHRLFAESPDYVARHPEIPLAKIYGMRNRITHAYEEVDMEIVWNLVAFDVPALQPKIVAALTEFKSEG